MIIGKLNESEVLSLNNVAVYGGLCALASLDRQSLKTQVLQSLCFKQFLELEPTMREILIGNGCSILHMLSIMFSIL